MKKLIITLLLIVSGLMFQTLRTEAEEDLIISSERVELISKGRVNFSKIDFNLSNYTSTGYVTLEMGYSEIYEIDLSNILQFIENYDAENVKRMYLDFSLASVYTGVPEAQTQWVSPHPDWDVATKTIDLGTSFTNTVTAEIWWNIIGQSGGAPSMTETGGLRIYSIHFVIEYETPIEIYTPINGWEELPIGTSLMTNDKSIQDFFEQGEVNPVQLDKVSDNNYDIYFDLLQGQYVAKNITLPTSKNNREPIFSFYFASTTERFLILYYDLNQENIWDSDFIVWNLTLGQYDEAFTQTVYGVASVRGDGLQTINMMFVDIVIPWDLDSIVSVKLQYEYRHHYIIGGFGDWIKVTKQTVIEGSTTAYELPYYRFWSRFVTNAVNQMVGDRILQRSQIREVTSEYDLNKKVEFTEKINDQKNLNLSQSNIFIPQAKVYELYLGQSNKNFSNAVEMKEIVLMNIRYMNDFQEYEYNFPKQVITDAESKFEDKMTWLDKIWEFISRIYLIFAFVAPIAITYYLVDWFPKLFKFKPLIVVTYAFLVYVLYVGI